MVLAVYFFLLMLSIVNYKLTFFPSIKETHHRDPAATEPTKQLFRTSDEASRGTHHSESGTIMCARDLQSECCIPHSASC